MQHFISILSTVDLSVHKLLKLHKDDVCKYANVLFMYRFVNRPVSSSLLPLNVPYFTIPCVV